LFKDVQYLNGKKANPKKRIVEIMHAENPGSVKETMLRSVVCYDGPVRLLICLIAFRMGVGTKGVCTIIHFGPLSNFRKVGVAVQAPVVQTVDSAIHHLNNWGQIVNQATV